MERIYQAMDNITRPYELANWQPEPFEEFINEAGFAEKISSSKHKIKNS